MRLTLLSRASDLAQIQARIVQRVLEGAFPDLHVTRLTRESIGDLRPDDPLLSLGDKGAFTADLSGALAAGAADIVVHSWKDLPIDAHADTVIAGTLERADPRDVIIVRPEAREERPARLTVLTSSPRRGWMLASHLPGLLPWPVDEVRCADVRGNIPTRLRRLREGRGDALIVAKAALDRLLTADAPFDAAAERVRALVEGCSWSVLPIRTFPSAPAQGALAIEVARARTDVIARVRAISHDATFRDVEEERAILARHGGGCHLPLGATVLTRAYGRVVSVRVKRGADVESACRLECEQTMPPAAAIDGIWPRPDERDTVVRERLPIAPLSLGTDEGLWVARADAWPGSVAAGTSRAVWTAGERTWRALAAQGVWVHGCADGFGDAEPPGIDALLGRAVTWRRMTHAAAAGGDPDATATYVARRAFPGDLGSRTHFFWSSGTDFTAALERWPSIRGGWHASGPGRTARAIGAALLPKERVSVWLDIDAWFAGISR